MDREEVAQVIKSARDRGERPDLSGFDLRQADLSRFDLRGAILTGPLVILIGADLCGADLSRADLGRTLFRKNPLAGIFRPGDMPEPTPDEVADLNPAKYDSKTRFPEGFDRYGELEKVD